MEVTNIALRLFEGTGEGPHYDTSTDELLLVNIPHRTIEGTRGYVFRKKLGDSTASFERHDLGENYVTFAIPTTSNTILVGLNQSVAELTWPHDGSKPTHTIVTSVEEGKPTRFNDAKCDPRGRLLAGTMSLEKAPAVVVAEEVGAIHGIDIDRSIRVIDDKYTLSNGMAWTLDEKTMFFIDSIMQKVFAYTYDPDNFAVSNRRVLIDFKQHEDLKNVYPDGCCIDTSDRLWIACYDGSRVICVDTTSGQRVTEIKFPTPGVTSCCFAGPSLDQMIVTTSNTGDAEGGSLYRVTNLGAKGLPMVPFKG